jgi:ferredoxin
MIEDIKSRVAEHVKKLDGVVALRLTEFGSGPHLFQKNDDLDQLVMEPRYPVSETASKIQKLFTEARIGIVARGCDVRALVEMAKRAQIDPERLVIIGVACSSEQAEICHCQEPNPRLEDWPEGEMIGEPGEPAGPNPLVTEHQNLKLEERWKFWQDQFTKCIKCYGCRDICPVCFCDACALEDPLWVEPGLLVPDFPMYHLIKAMHMTTRCIACRQCEVACPAGIPLTVLYDLIRADVSELIDYRPGEDINSLPPLSLTLAEAPMKSDLAT